MAALLWAGLGAGQLAGGPTLMLASVLVGLLP